MSERYREMANAYMKHNSVKHDPIAVVVCEMLWSALLGFCDEAGRSIVRELEKRRRPTGDKRI